MPGTRMPPSEGKPLKSFQGPTLARVQPGPVHTYEFAAPMLSSELSQHSAKCSSMKGGSLPSIPTLCPSAPLSDRKTIIVLSYSPIDFK